MLLRVPVIQRSAVETAARRFVLFGIADFELHPLATDCYGRFRTVEGPA
jgi:hypothetical protein